ncbi:hypothetical protein CPB85DRAFT_1569684 [Mucidula mucida]|nr:hypothetical protein CPB85DRAFT_1569684 [Mucidula mucida]
MSAIFKIDSLQLRRVGTFHGSTVHNSAPSSVDGLAGQAWIPGEKACFLRMRKSPSLEHVDIPPIGKHSAYGSTALPLPPPFHVPQDISLPWRRSLEASAVLAGPAFGPAGKGERHHLRTPTFTASSRSSPRRCTPQFNLDSLLFDAVSHWPSWLPSTSHIPSRARSRSIREYTHAATLRLAWSPSNSKTDIPYAASRRMHLTVDIDFDLMECMLSNASVTDLSSGLIFSVISGIVGTGATSSSPPSPLPIFSSEHSAADRDADLTEPGFTHALGRLGDVSLSSPNSG